MSDISDDNDEYSSTENDDIQSNFNKAADYIQQHHSEIPANYLLEFYGLYKQSTCGECTTSRPGIFNLQGRTKWDAWHNLGKLDRSKAMELYVEKLQQLKPDWNQSQGHHKNTSKNDGGKKSQWVCTSIHAQQVEEEIPDTDKTPFDYIRENNLTKLKKVVNKQNVNEIKDENGMLLIHWATDRNASEILQYLISVGANVNFPDDELQTALHYAASCGHIKCIQILLENNADKNVLDRDGLSCIDVAYDDTIKNFLTA